MCRAKKLVSDLYCHCLPFADNDTEMLCGEAPLRPMQ
jgi:hypothetical protein